MFHFQNANRIDTTPSPTATPPATTAPAPSASVLISSFRPAAEAYTAGLAGLPLVLPEAPQPGAAGANTHAWHLYAVQVRDDSPLDRDATVAGLTEAGIGTSVHFIPLHLHPYWRDTYGLTPEQFPVATDLFARSFSLPIYPRMTDADVDRVVDALQRLLSV